jgi:hypothetical protein
MDSFNFETHPFKEPTSCISSAEDIKDWLNSNAFAELMGFIQLLVRSSEKKRCNQVECTPVSQ